MNGTRTNFSSHGFVVGIGANVGGVNAVVVAKVPPTKVISGKNVVSLNKFS